MGMGRTGALVGLCLVAAGCAPHRTVAEITMHNGAVLTVLEPEAFYQAICDQGLYRVDGDPDADALRAVRSRADPTTAIGPYDQIKWSDIDSIAFGKGLGNQLDYCSDTPLNVAATIHFKDGHVEQRALADTTDRGIEGMAERGPVVVPIRDIARLRMVPDGDWDWAKDRETGSPTTIKLHITRRDGTGLTVGDPEIMVPSTRYSELGVTPHRIYGLPALAGGARLEILWSSIASVTVSGDANALRGDIVYADGHREQMPLADGELSGAGIAPMDTSFGLHDIAKITITKR
jgi:hypothetical protein